MTSVPQPMEAIGPDNIDQVTAIAHWGQGDILGKAYTPDLSHLVIASTANGVEMYDMKAGKLMWSQNVPANAPSLSSDGSLLALATQNGIEVWNAATGDVNLKLKSIDEPFVIYYDTSRLNESDYVEKTAFSPDGHYLAAQIYSYKNNTPFAVYIWQIPDGQLIKTFQTSEWGFEFSSDSTLLAVNDAIWELPSWKRLCGIPGIDVTDAGPGDISFHFSNDDNYFAVHANDQLNIYQMPSGQLFRVSSLSSDVGDEFWLKNGMVISRLAIINIKDGTSSKTPDCINAIPPDGTVGACVYGEGILTLENDKDKTELKTFLVHINDQFFEERNINNNLLSKINWGPKTAELYNFFYPSISNLYPLEFSPDNASLVFGSLLINSEKGDTKHMDDSGLTDWESSLSFLALKNGKFLEPQLQGQNLEFYSYPDRQSQLTLQGAGSKLILDILSPDKSTLATMSFENHMAYISLWHMSDGTRIKKMACGNYTFGIAFSKDGSLLAALCGSGMIATIKFNVWRASDGTLVKTITDGVEGNHVTFSSNGTWMAVNAYSTAKRQYVERLYQLSNWKIYGEIGSECTSSVFTSDSSVLICSTQSGTLQFWRISDLTLLREITNPGIPAIALAVSSDGKYLAAALEDNTFMIWGISQLAQ
jgi:WD40 repeat protein